MNGESSSPAAMSAGRSSAIRWTAMKNRCLGTAALLAAIAACSAQPLDSSAKTYPLCEESEAQAVQAWLRISAQDRRDICALVARKNEYVVMSAARSHESLYDFPMVEVHMALVTDKKRDSGPTFFYWKREGGWKELKEVVGWQNAGEQ